MSTDYSTAQHPKTASVVSWVLYDLANTVFSMGVISFFLPMWVREQVGPGAADTTVGVVTAGSMFVIFLLAPILGSMTDRASRRLPFLTVATLGCVLSTSLMGRIGYTGTLLAFVLANAFYQAGLQFYDALLPSVSTPHNRGKIGGVGVAVGYVGSFLAIAVSLLAPRFGWTTTTAFALIAALFLAFAWPSFVWVEEARNAHPGRIWSWREITGGLRGTYRTLLASKEQPELRRFLIGRLFYTDPINTVIAMMALYSVNIAQQGGVDAQGAKRITTLVLAGSIVFAIVGGYAGGRLVDRFGPRRVLSFVLVSWFATFVLAASLGIFELPWKLLMGVSGMAGFSLGATWAADRPLMLELTPKERLGEFYGLYGMVGRFAAILGPAIWALSMSLLQKAGLGTLRAQGYSVAFLLLLIVVARWILSPVLSGRATGQAT